MNITKCVQRWSGIILDPWVKGHQNIHFTYLWSPRIWVGGRCRKVQQFRRRCSPDVPSLLHRTEGAWLQKVWMQLTEMSPEHRGCRCGSLRPWPQSRPLVHWSRAPPLFRGEPVCVAGCRCCGCCLGNGCGCRRGVGVWPSSADTAKAGRGRWWAARPHPPGGRPCRRCRRAPTELRCYCSVSGRCEFSKTPSAEKEERDLDEIMKIKISQIIFKLNKIIPKNCIILKWRKMHKIMKNFNKMSKIKNKNEQNNPQMPKIIIIKTLYINVYRP